MNYEVVTFSKNNTVTPRRAEVVRPWAKKTSQDCCYRTNSTPASENVLISM